MKIVTYNVGLLDIRFFGRLIFEFAPNTRARAKALGENLLDFDCDILVLQELYHKKDALQLLDILRLNFKYSLFSKFSHIPNFLGHGLAIFSKYPFSATQDIKFKQQLVDEGIFGPKGFLAATIDIPLLGNVFLINTHTSAGGFFQHPESEKTEACRHAQLMQIVNVSQDSGLNSIIAGDLNCGIEASAKNFNSMLENDFKSVDNISNNVEKGPTWDPLNLLNICSPHKTSPPQRIDHILFSNNFTKIIEVNSVTRCFTNTLNVSGNLHTLSDHYGIAVEFDGIHK